MNRTAVERRKEIKNCEAIAKKQNCTESNKFLYHCVINEYGDALVEVCAPVYIMNGKFPKAFMFYDIIYVLTYYEI